MVKQKHLILTVEDSRKKDRTRPKRKASRINYGDLDEDETASEDKNEEDLDRGQDSPFPS